MPRVGSVLGIMQQRAKERRRQRIQIRLCFADDVARDEFRRVLVHMNEAMQLAQDVVGDMARGARLAVQVNRDVGVLETDLLYECAQALQRDFGFFLAAPAEFFVVDRQQKCRSTALLLRERSQIAIAGDPEDFHPLFFNGIGQCADAQAAGILGAEVFIDDDNGKPEFHNIAPGTGNPCGLS